MVRARAPPEAARIARAKPEVATPKRLAKAKAKAKASPKSAVKVTCAKMRAGVQQVHFFVVSPLSRLDARASTCLQACGFRGFAPGDPQVRRQGAHQGAESCGEGGAFTNPEPLHAYRPFVCYGFVLGGPGL